MGITANLDEVIALTIQKARFQKKNMEVSAKTVVKQTFTNIVNDTPVKTGFLKRNWRVRNGRIGSRRVPKKNYRVKNYNTAKVIPMGHAAIDAWKFSSNESLYFVNFTEYADRIEDGYSKRQPDGMMARNVEAFRARLDAFLRSRGQK